MTKWSIMEKIKWSLKGIQYRVNVLLPDIVNYVDSHYREKEEIKKRSRRKKPIAGDGDGLSTIGGNQKAEAANVVKESNLDGIHFSMHGTLDDKTLQEIAMIVAMDEEDDRRRARETFSETLLRMITESGMKDSEVYKKANVSRQLFSKIRKDKDYQPTKNTVLAFVIAMHLDIWSALELLGKAGFTLSPCKKEDLVVRYFIENEWKEPWRYDIFLINETLSSLNLPTLF